MTNNFPSNQQKNQLSEQEKKGFRLAIGGTIVLALVSLYYFSPYSNIEISFLNTNVQMGLLSLVYLFSALLIRNGYAKKAYTLMIYTPNITIAIIAIGISGADIPLALMSLAITFSVASSLNLPPRKVGKTMYGSAITVTFLFFLYFVEPFERKALPASNTTTWGILGLFFLVLLILILKQFPTYALRTKLILGFLLLSTFIVSIAFTLVSMNMRKILTANAQEQLLANASISAKSIDHFLTYSLDSVNTASASLNLRSYLLLSPKIRTNSLKEQQVQNLLFSLANSNADILSYGILDLDGMNILDSDSRNIGKSEAEYDYFQYPLNANNKYISPVLYFPDEKEGVLFFSVPVIYNDPDVVVGILRVKYSASALQKIFNAEKSIAGKESLSVLFDSNHIILAHTLSPQLIGKTTYTPSAEEIKSLRENFLIPTQLEDSEISHNFTKIEEGLTNFVTTPYFTSDETELDKRISGAVTQLNTVPWLTLSAQPNDIFLAPIQQQTRRIILSSLVLIILAVFTSFGLANILVAPLIRLENTAQEFTKGNLETRATIEADDEIGALAHTFNNLVSRLNKTINTLEHRIEERTQALKQRTTYLEASSNVAQAASEILDTNTLIQEVVEIIKERFNFYYVGLFLIDEENEQAVLKAGTGKAGQKMLDKEHKIKIGEGMIGWSIENKQARIALDVGKDAVQFKNPDLPKTRSESALPLRSRGRVLGALTVQSTEKSAFDNSNIIPLQTMVDQVAVALDNAELLTKSEDALEAERKAYGEFSQKTWRKLTESQAVSRFIVDQKGKAHPITKSKENNTLTQASEERTRLEDDKLTAIIPIKNRGYILGGIKIRKGENEKPWTPEELEITAAISEHLSVALDSARHFDETQRKAQREAILSDISAKIGASMQLDSILKTTAKELSDALESPEVIFELVDPLKENQVE